MTENRQNVHYNSVYSNPIQKQTGQRQPQRETDEDVVGSNMK